ncbi:MAG: D-alanyl-D-alanine carboxypeptidase [Oscillospiraceae bacterium]|nr:D-alanyl-D-alanine carboxypeptidase [Oscillospiraceae bacterium]
MKNKRFISLLLAGFFALAPLSVSFAAPTSAPDTSTSTVTSPDGTTRTVTSSSDTVESTSQPDDDDTAAADYDDDYTADTDSSDTNDYDEQGADYDSGSVSLENGVTMEDSSLTPPTISYAQSAMLLDMSSGRILYSKNPDDRVYPASTTKIMTGILALELGNMSDTVTATYDALKDITLEDSHMGILIGEELTMEQLVNGMLVYSANDAANVIAIQIAGSMDAFVQLMNEKAQELGMTGTNFVNACGTHDDNHYTTARDLSILAQYAMQNEQFREIVKKPIYNIPATNKYSSERILVNTNLFLGTSRSTYYYYPPAIGIKTGHTSEAGYCLVSAASYNDTELLAVVMNCANADTKEQAYSYIDSKSLFEFGFDNYLHQILATVGDIIYDSKVYEAKDDMRVAVTVENDVSALIANKEGSIDEVEKTIDMPEQISAPITKGDVLGTVTYTYKGNQIGTANLVATNDVERNNLLHVFHLILKVLTSPFFFIPAILLIILILFSRHQKKKRERKRRIQQLKRNRQRTSPDNETGTRTPNRNASRTERVSRETKGSNSRYRK